MITYDQYLQFSPYFAQEDIEKEGERLKFFKLFDTLPQNVRNLISSMDTAEKIMNIGATFGLDEFDTEAVSLVVRKIATRETPITDEAGLIANETGLSRERAQSLLNLIVDEILAPVMDDLKKIQSQITVQPKPVQSTKPVLPEPAAPSPDSDRIVDLRNRQN